MPLSCEPVYYYLCGQCGFCFAPELYQWSLEDFCQKICNDGYQQIDPDYIKARPATNAGNINHMFADKKKQIKHLDYGGGNGLLSRLLTEHSWDSFSYDPHIRQS